MKKEPVIAAAIARILVSLAAGHGLDLTTDQVLTVVVVLEAVLAFAVRQFVTPTAKRKQPSQ